jgi:hypothetical protein
VQGRAAGLASEAARRIDVEMFDQIVSTKIEDGKVTLALAKLLESLRKYA